MGGKSSSPPPPDYTPVAQADAAASNEQLQLGREQLQWSKDQFNTTWPYAQQYLQQQTTSSAAQTASAANQQQFYDAIYKPIEGSFADQANNYNSPANSDRNAGMAMADVASAFDSSRAAALSNLESYGIDPSQTRFQALDLGTRISQAAATAGADTQSRLNTQSQGFALQGQAINIGRGYPSAINSSYAGATNSGAAGLSGANSTIQTGSNAMTGSTAFTGQGLNALQGETGALNAGFQNQMAGANFNAQQSASMSSGIGGAVGMAAMGAMMFM